MADVSVPIVIPVAVPQRFLGAPVLLSATFVCGWILVALGLFVTRDYALLGIFCMVMIIPTQIVAILIGRREPHFDNLLRVSPLFNRTTRVVGNPRSKVFYAS